MKAMHHKTNMFCTRQGYNRRSGSVRRRMCGNTIVYMSPFGKGETYIYQSLPWKVSLEICKNKFYVSLRQKPLALCPSLVKIRSG